MIKRETHRIVNQFIKINMQSDSNSRASCGFLSDCELMDSFQSETFAGRSRARTLTLDSSHSETKSFSIEPSSGFLTEQFQLAIEGSTPLSHPVQTCSDIISDPPLTCRLAPWTPQVGRALKVLHYASFFLVYASNICEHLYLSQINSEKFMTRSMWNGVGLLTVYLCTPLVVLTTVSKCTGDRQKRSYTGSCFDRVAIWSPLAMFSAWGLHTRSPFDQLWPFDFVEHVVAVINMTIGALEIDMCSNGAIGKAMGSSRYLLRHFTFRAAEVTIQVSFIVAWMLGMDAALCLASDAGYREVFNTELP